MHDDGRFRISYCCDCSVRLSPTVVDWQFPFIIIFFALVLALALSMPTISLYWFCLFALPGF